MLIVVTSSSIDEAALCCRSRAVSFGRKLFMKMDRQGVVQTVSALRWLQKNKRMMHRGPLRSGVCEVMYEATYAMCRDPRCNPTVAPVPNNLGGRTYLANPSMAIIISDRRISLPNIYSTSVEGGISCITMFMACFRTLVPKQT